MARIQKEIANHNKLLLLVYMAKKNMLSALMKTYSTRKIMDKETSILQISDPEKLIIAIFFLSEICLQGFKSNYFYIAQQSGSTVIRKIKDMRLKGVHINLLINGKQCLRF